MFSRTPKISWYHWKYSTGLFSRIFYMVLKLFGTSILKNLSGSWILLHFHDIFVCVGRILLVCRNLKKKILKICQGVANCSHNLSCRIPDYVISDLTRSCHAGVSELKFWRFQNILRGAETRLTVFFEIFSSQWRIISLTDIWRILICQIRKFPFNSLLY